MRLTVQFEYDTVTGVSRVMSAIPRPPFGLGEIHSVLYDTHFTEDAKKALTKAVNAAIKGNVDALRAVSAS